MNVICERKKYAEFTLLHRILQKHFLVYKAELTYIESRRQAVQLKTTRDECEIQFNMQTMLESYNSTMCEHNAVF